MNLKHPHVLLLDAKQRRFNAGPKARLDTAHFLSAIGFRIQAVPISRSRYWQRLLAFFLSTFSWIRFRPGEVVWCQFPVGVTTAVVLGSARRRGHKVMAFVHDIEGLKTQPVDWAKVDEEVTKLKDFDGVLGLNEVIGAILRDRGVPVLANMNMWDYVCEKPMQSATPSLQALRVIFAGSLAPDKSSFIYKLSAVHGVRFELYGEGFDAQAGTAGHVQYKGSFAPENPPFQADGALGLVWDGADVETCQGNFGAYLAFNTPHKASMYLAAGLPVLIWQGAALAPMIASHNAGIQITSLQELSALFEGMTAEHYAKLAEGARQLGQKIRAGQYLYAAVQRIDNALPR